MNKQYLPLLTYLVIFLFLLCVGMLYQSRKTSDGITSITATEPESSSGKQDSSAGLSESPSHKKKIAITFDDGPHPVYTLKLLDGLAQRNVKATFFIIGESAERYPEVIKRMHDEGHLIGNHTYSHVQLTCINSTKAVEEIRKTNDILVSITGETVRYIRPPFGLYNKTLADSSELVPVLWTVDPRDWSVLNTGSVVSHVIKKAKENDVILLHDIFDTSVDAALQIIDILLEQGYTFVTVDELMESNPKIALYR
ncbi:MAG: polysaccharide deacetylase family protein [Lachnospiraceae bacterium]|nr:polysaccharide deacetylase family protein [Lachnospiraceae bacterium]